MEIHKRDVIKTHRNSEKFKSRRKKSGIEKNFIQKL